MNVRLRNDILPFSPAQLLVRDCYSEMYDTIKQEESERVGARKVRISDNGQRTYVHHPSIRVDHDKAIVISGQPGIGKPWFQSYLLVRRLLAGKPTMVQVSTPVEGREDLHHTSHIRLDENGVRKLDDDLYLSVESNAEIWVLVDQTPVRQPAFFRYHSWLVIITSSPNKENFKNLMKGSYPREFFFSGVDLGGGGRWLYD